VSPALQRLRAEIRFDRDAFAQRVTEQLAVLRQEIVSAAPAILGELNELDQYLGRVAEND
jgi:hypothetical protein